MSIPQGDFASVMDAANRMTQPSVTHPFGPPVSGLARVGQGPGVPVRQTTAMFFCPRDLEGYDALCNRGWAGEITLRYEERTPLAKEGEVMILVSYFEAAHPEPRPAAANPAGNDQEPEVRPHRIP